MMKSFLLFLFPFGVYGVELDAFLQEALKTHPAVEQSRLELKAQEQGLSSFLTLEDPMIGWMKEGKMEFWTLGQNLKFPYKYKIAKDLQKTKIFSAQVALNKAQWEFRSKILIALFRYEFALQNVKFIEAQRSNLKEALKLMASRRASGGVKQQEELRSYLEQTKLETELIIQNQLLRESKADLESLCGSLKLDSLPLKVERPKISIERLQELNNDSGFELTQSLASLNQVEQERKVAHWEYMPDFKLSTKQPLKNREGDKTYSVEMSIPLWGWGKQGPLSSASEFSLQAQRKNVEFVKREQGAKIQSLISKIENLQNLLVLYETSLLPQSKGNLDSALTSYKVGGVRFLDLVDAQKLLYSERMNYLDNTLKFVDSVLELETLLGKKISSFPVGIL